jgi:hypothetical protein
MMIRTASALALAVALQLLAVPVMAQGTTDKSATDKGENAHHYQGGPQTGVLHMSKHPELKGGAKGRSGGHHYSGGPKTESHHMGEKK